MTKKRKLKSIFSKMGTDELTRSFDPEFSFSSRVVGDIEIVASAFNFLSAFGAGVESSARAAHKMLEAQFLLTTFPAKGHHHLWLFLGQRTILKCIHADP